MAVLLRRRGARDPRFDGAACGSRSGSRSSARAVLAAVAVRRLTDNPYAIVAAPALTLLDAVGGARARGAHAGAARATDPARRGAARRTPAHRGRRRCARGRRAVPEVAVRAPALAAIVLFSARAASGRSLAAAPSPCAVQAVVFTALFGFGLWDDSVLAQMGFRAARVRRCCAASGARRRGACSGCVALAALRLPATAPRPRTLPLLKVLTALAVADAPLRSSPNTKDGTGLNILVPVEAALVPLALAGAVLVPAPGGPRAPARGSPLAQSALADHDRAHRDAVHLPHVRARRLGHRGRRGRPRPRARPRRRLPAHGPPTPARRTWAFLADRPVPDDQPDQFLPFHAPRLADVGKAHPARSGAALPV